MNLVEAPSKNTASSKSQQAFNRLIKKVEDLQNSIKARDATLDECLNYYNSNVRPVEQKLMDKITECIPVFFSFHKNSKICLSRFERETLKELIRSLLNRVCEKLTPYEIPQELRGIIEDIEGINFDQAVAEEFAKVKEDCMRFSAEKGIDVDLSDINANDSSEELRRKFADALRNSKENSEGQFNEDNTTESTKKKSKRQIEKEQKANALAEIQKKGLSTIYKQLAKALHPDLEQDLSLKSEKEVLMKKLTTAYDNQDLHTLLTLEIEWMNRSGSDEGKGQPRTEEQLKIYSALLKEQLQSLKEELEFIIQHPRYHDIKPIIERVNATSYLKYIKDKEEEFIFDTNQFSKTITALKQNNRINELKQILEDFASTEDDEDDDLLLFLESMFRADNTRN